jgi:hypothetical protein
MSIFRAGKIRDASLVAQAEQAAEKVGSGRILVAQALCLCALLNIWRIHQSN